MDRRQFAKLAAALFVGKATAESVARDDVLLLTSARTNDFGPSQEFDAATWVAHPSVKDRVRWLSDLFSPPPIGTITAIEERFAGTELAEIHCRVKFDGPVPTVWVPIELLEVIHA